jgi:acyl-CoA thioester hydrolase
MSDFVTYRGAILPWHCDHMGHMNVMWYVGKFDEATWNLFAHIGLSPSYFRGEPFGIAGVQQNIRYQHELMAGDVIEIWSRLVDARLRRIQFIHTMRNAETDQIASICDLTCAEGVPVPGSCASGCRATYSLEPLTMRGRCAATVHHRDVSPGTGRPPRSRPRAASRFR